MTLYAFFNLKLGNGVGRILTDPNATRGEDQCGYAYYYLLAYCYDLIIFHNT